jgi:methylglyoxal synthase
VGLLKESASGGYLHIAHLIANHDIKIVICLCDPCMINIDDSGMGVLLQACTVHNVPLANNIATAEFILERYLEKQMATRYRTPRKGACLISDLYPKLEFGLHPYD